MSLTYLLDVNILIALFDESHSFHAAASAWFNTDGRGGWASCPITENGLVRVMSHPRYSNWVGGPQYILALFKELRGEGNHQFFADSVSLSDAEIFDLRRTRNANALTDIYLLGLAKANGAKLATFDRHINIDAVKGGADALHLLTA